MTTHTPGPRWTLDAGRCLVRDGVPLATLHGVGQYQPTELDDLARALIPLLNADAAAPELLAACVELVERAEAAGNIDGLPEYEAARAAIAKARGS